MDFLDELQERVLCADGAMGTLLIERGISITSCFEELCISRPEMVSSIHREYIAAGARVIETNTFGANSVRLARYGLENRVNEINWHAVQVAKDAAKGSNTYVAGGVGPLGVSETEARALCIDRRAVFQEQIGALLDGGVHLLFLETFQDLDELLLALHVKQSLHHLPAVCLLSCEESGRLPSGLPLHEALERLRAADAEVVGLNCVTGPQTAQRLVNRLPSEGCTAVLPNAGRPRYQEGRYHYEAEPDYFGKAIATMARKGVNLLGGCCGTTPAHIASAAAAIAGMKPSPRVSVGVAPAEMRGAPAEVEPEESSLIERLKGGARVIFTEFDPPKNLALTSYFEGARSLIEAGSDALTLADNSLAILRVSNLALGIRLKEMGIQTVLHLSCRDRNLLGLQSDLMGMAAFGIRHVLPLTGDPAKGGDHPGATSVYDTNSIKLIEIIRKMNEGFSMAGQPLKAPTHFEIGCTFNPNAKNLGAQVSRLERKLEAGAQYVMTQPIFDTSLVKKTAEEIERFGVPVFLGVWPLLNGRQALFLHNEVPGITVPDAVLDRMRGKERQEGLAEGLAVAREMVDAILDRFPGIYLMTPFQRADVSAELVRYTRSLPC